MKTSQCECYLRLLTTISYLLIYSIINKVEKIHSYTAATSSLTLCVYQQSIDAHWDLKCVYTDHIYHRLSSTTFLDNTFFDELKGEDGRTEAEPGCLGAITSHASAQPFPSLFHIPSFKKCNS